MCGLYTREINLNPYFLYSQQIVLVQYGYAFLDPFGIHFIKPLGTSYFLA